VLGVVNNMDLGSLQHPAEIYVGILASTILFIATNAGILGVSRLSYSMGQHRQLPEFLRLLSPRFRTPYIAIAVFGAIACLAIVPGEADFLGVIYAFGAMLSFTMAHASVTTLRLRKPDIERPYKGPLNLRVGDRELPLFAILGGLGTGIALIVATVLDLRVLVSGVGWMAVGIALYVAYRRRQGLALTETHKIVSPKPAVEHEVEYESILVAFEDNDYSAEAVSTATRLAARRRRGIHVLVTISVPPNSPIDASLPEQEAKAASVIDQARVLGGRRVTGHWEKVRPGQAGRRIVEEAKDIRARAIVMPLPPRRTGSSLFGRTLETVLSERPARVIIDSSRVDGSKAAT
jgi:APA family basic amino acid/polyamine antiporter